MDDAAGMLGECPEEFGGFGIPETDGAIIGGGGDTGAVGTPGDAVDGARVAV